MERVSPTSPRRANNKLLHYIMNETSEKIEEFAKYIKSEFDENKIDPVEIIANYKWEFKNTKTPKTIIYQNLTSLPEWEAPSENNNQNNPTYHYSKQIIYARSYISRNLNSGIFSSYDVAKFMTNEWGQVGNKEDSLQIYAKLVDKLKKQRDQTISEIFSYLREINRHRNIASWSKILSAISPDKYFVYDYRICQTLRLFWSIHFGDGDLSPYPMPIAEGTNNRATLIRILLELGNAKYLDSKNNHTPYDNYCNFISCLREQLFPNSIIHNKLPWIEEKYPNATESVAKQLTEMTIFSLLQHDTPKNFDIYKKATYLKRFIQRYFNEHKQNIP